MQFTNNGQVEELKLNQLKIKDLTGAGDSPHIYMVL